MPMKFGVWNIDNDGVDKIEFSKMPNESRLERVLEENIDVIDPSLMVVGTQVATDHGKTLDILAVDDSGDLHVLELKRDRTPRDVVAQVLDYASWVEDLGYEQVKQIHNNQHDEAFEQALAENFSDPPRELNDQHHLLVVASELDPATERILNYLSDTHGVPINALLFRYFEEDDSEYLARSWLIDPAEVEQSTEQKGRSKKESWNGRDYYVSFGVHEDRRWADARRYGFISGGGGHWYVKTLYNLDPGDRVFVNIPEHGYVGVGEVVEEAVPVTEFEVTVEGEDIPILDADMAAESMDKWVGDEEKVERLVRVDWLATRDKENAVWEKGMFANQHTVCKLRNDFTIRRLIERFGLQGS